MIIKYLIISEILIFLVKSENDITVICVLFIAKKPLNKQGNNQNARIYCIQ